eukprot:TRINITY_DN1086_c0_g1_i2.p1 TRINITY_DN1086_c0_g1~~TRINITY_DN1086_c0_g1_i2.p1  ORF type:complete len:611 (+),score=178.44 TRINITY_DN1086_c0_g1_i2:67-1833(+)
MRVVLSIIVASLCVATVEGKSDHAHEKHAKSSNKGAAQEYSQRRIHAPSPGPVVSARQAQYIPDAYRKYVPEMGERGVNYDKYVPNMDANGASYEKYMQGKPAANTFQKNVLPAGSYQKDIPLSLPVELLSTSSDVSNSKSMKQRSNEKQKDDKTLQNSGGDFNRYQSQYGVEHKKYLRSYGAASDKASAYQKYQSQYGGDYQKYMQGQGATQGSDYQQYVDKYAGDFQKHMKGQSDSSHRGLDSKRGKAEELVGLKNSPNLLAAQSEKDGMKSDQTAKAEATSQDQQEQMQEQEAKTAAEMKKYYKAQYMPGAFPEDQAEMQKQEAKTASEMNDYYRSQYMPGSFSEDQGSERKGHSQAEIQRQEAKAAAEMGKVGLENSPNLLAAQSEKGGMKSDQTAKTEATSQDQQEQMQEQEAKTAAEMKKYYKAQYMPGAFPEDQAEMQKQEAKTASEMNDYYRSQYMPGSFSKDQGSEGKGHSQAEIQRQEAKSAAEIGNYFRSQYAPKGEDGVADQETSKKKDKEGGDKDKPLAEATLLKTLPAEGSASTSAVVLATAGVVGLLASAAYASVPRPRTSLQQYVQPPPAEV